MLSCTVRPYALLCFLVRQYCHLATDNIVCCNISRTSLESRMDLLCILESDGHARHMMASKEVQKGTNGRTTSSYSVVSMPRVTKAGADVA